jgi:pseudaminic acid synthase
MKINNRLVGSGAPVYIVAELSGNHNQNFNEALELIKAAKVSGADAVKLQTYTPDTLTIDCDNKYFRVSKGALWEGKTLYNLYKEAYTPWEWHPKLKKYAENLGLDLFSTPFDQTSVNFLEEMDVPAYKVASFELVDIPLIRYIARKKKPMIISTGMGSLSEIAEAVTAAKESGCSQLALLKCTSAYPADPSEMNLATIPNMAKTFDVPIGLSDHSKGIAVPIVAVSLGACIIEKHLTLSRSKPGPDSAFSLEPDEFKEMVEAIRIAEKAIGKVNYNVTKKEKIGRTFRRSLFIVKDIKKGEILKEDNLRSIRPGYGISPKYYSYILGKKVNKDLKKGTPLQWKVIE